MGEDDSIGKEGAAVHLPLPFHSISEHSMSQALGWAMGTQWWAKVGMAYSLMVFIVYGGNRH